MAGEVNLAYIQRMIADQEKLTAQRFEAGERALDLASRLLETRDEHQAKEIDALTKRVSALEQDRAFGSGRWVAIGFGITLLIGVVVVVLQTMGRLVLK